MNKLILTMLVTCISAVAIAKDGFYRAASVGIGRGSQNVQTPVQFWTDNYLTFEPTSTWQASMDLGYRLHNWRFVAGVQYLADGYNADNLNGWTNTHYVLQARFEHVNIPVRLGYSINLSKKLALVPHIGASVGYNFNVKQVDKNGGETKITRDTDADFERFGYHRISFLALGQLDVRYQVCDMMAITAGPRYNMMLGSMQDASKNMNQSLLLKSYTINVGVELAMPKGEAAAE